MPMPRALAFSMAMVMHLWPITWPMPSWPSTTAVVGVSLMISKCVTGFWTPDLMRSRYMGLKRLQPWDSMPRRSLSSNTSVHMAASASGTPYLMNTSVTKPAMVVQSTV